MNPRSAAVPSARPWRWAIVALLAAGLTLAGVPGPASAHPNFLGTTPRDGSQLSSAPASVVVRLDERVRLAPQGARIVDGTGKVVPSTVKFSNGNKTLTITPTKRLGRGRFAAAWNVWSVEGHFVAQAIAFTVATPTVKGSPAKIKTMPIVPATLDGDRPGARTISIVTTQHKGTVSWRGPGIGEPIIWKFHGDGKTATASGVLPIAGDWTCDIDLSTADNVLIPKGKVTLK